MRGHQDALLTGIELYPGNVLRWLSEIRPVWSRGRSDSTRSSSTSSPGSARDPNRFGSLEFGVMVAERADTWTRMIMQSPNKPINRSTIPTSMFAKLYGGMKHQRKPWQRSRRACATSFSRWPPAVSASTIAGYWRSPRAAIIRETENQLREMKTEATCGAGACGRARAEATKMSICRGL